MRAVSAATAALLANPPSGLQSADLFTFTLRDGVTIYRWTSYDRDLTVNGNVYSSRKPWLQRSRWGVANTMQVPTLEITLLALNDAFGGGIDIKGQITNGLFDGASAALDRIFFGAGTTVISDSGNGVATSFTTVGIYNLDATVRSAFTPAAGLSVGLAVSGFSPGDIVRASLPAGQTYTAWNSFAGVAGQWRCFFNAIPDGVSASQFEVGPFTMFSSQAAAFAGFGTPPTFSGASTYTLFFLDTVNATDNTGGLSVMLEKGTPTYAGVRLFGGNVANIDITGNSATINIKGKSNLLDQYAPRNLYQLGCEHAFCDAGCTLLRASYTTSYTVGSGSGGATRTFIPWSSAPGTPNRYRYGTVAFTTGACSGQARTVRLGDSTGLTLTQPLLGTPAAGDSFTAFEGCDKQFNSASGQDCTARSNTQHWRAFPYVPPADSAA